MKYAVISSRGKQYIAEIGKSVEMEKIDGDNDKLVNFEKVLLTVNDGKVEIGTPFIKGALVKGKILKQGKGEKVRVVKFRAKSKYRRTTGFRKLLTHVMIEQISD